MKTERNDRNESNLLPVDRLVQDCTNTSEYLTNNIWKIAFSPCSQYLAIPKQDIYGQYSVIVLRCSDWHAQILNKTNFSKYHHFICTSAIWSLAFGQRQFGQSQSNRISTLLDHNMALIPPTRRELLGRRRSSLSVNRRHDFTRDLFLAAGLADGKINIWNIRTGELTLILTDHHSTVCGLDFTLYTMQLASCSHDTTIKLWDLLDDGNMYKTLKEWTHVINAVKWSPDEALLCAVGPYALVALFDTTTWKKLYAFGEHLHSVVDCAFSSDSALLATASYDTSVILWSTTTGEMIKKYAHQIPIPSRIYAGGDNGAFVRSIAITKNNQFLVSACDDNKVRWFPLMSNRSSKSIYERTETNVLSVALTSDGRTMAIGNRNSEVHILSTYSNSQTNQAPSLRYLCRLTINSSCGTKRHEILHLPLSQNLINYLLYKDIKTK